MGHSYVERLPRTKVWADIVRRVEAGESAAEVAGAVVQAASQFLLPLSSDHGVIESFWHLVRLPLAASEDAFAPALRDVGLDVPDAPGLVDVLAAVSDAIDRRVPPAARTDLGEMAQASAVETVAAVFGPRVAGLYGEDPGEVRQVLAATATRAEFARVAVAFFARLVGKAIDFFVSRMLPDRVGDGRRFRSLAAQAEFRDGLREYAVEVAGGVRDFAGRWFVKQRHKYDGRVPREEAGAFVHHAAEKLKWALERE